MTLASVMLASVTPTGVALPAQFSVPAAWRPTPLSLPTAWRPVVALAATAPEIRITPAAPVQGDTVTILIRAPADAAVSVEIDRIAVAVFLAGEGTRRALIGTDPNTAVGPHTIAVTVTVPGSESTKTIRAVRVGSGKFGVRHLTLPPKTVALITPQNLATERRALDAVLNRRTPEAWWQGPMQAPAAGPVDSPYGEQGYYNGRRMWWHQGVDFDVPAGAPVVAANAGVVALARALPLGGNTVVIDHGQGVLTEYLHLSAFTVHEGDRVARGALIGRIGATGLVTGPSLHWGVYVAGRWVNPLFWLAPRPGLTL